MLFILFIICLLLYHIYDKVKSIMIEKNEIFTEIQDNLGLICDDGRSGADLAADAGVAITNKLRAVSVAPAAVAPIWAWLENTNVKIFARFYVDKKIDDDFMSDLSSRISASFREGANGATVFVKLRDLKQFVSELNFVRDDLFFNKTLAIGLDINEIDDWTTVFDLLQGVRADALSLYLSHDDGDKSDFVGRIYAMLNANWGDWRGALYFCPNDNIARADQFYRLVEQLRIAKLPTTMFWIKNE